MEGKSGFSLPAPSLPWQKRVCSHVCAHVCAHGVRHGREPAPGRVLSPPLSQDPPRWLVATAATDSTGRHLDRMSDGAQKRALSALCLENGIFHVL